MSRKMSNQVVDRNKLRVLEGGPNPSTCNKIETVDDDVLMFITQAFCPNGHNLVAGSSVYFEGHPGISLLLSDGTHDDLVVLSPVHGDRRKACSLSFRLGARLRLMCSQCQCELDMLFPCSCGKGELVSLYLTPEQNEGNVAAICNVWGCPRSRIIDNWQIISEFVNGTND